MNADATEHAGAAPRLVNGVFVGGGAKGIAYAGALQAMEDRGLWFGSVAGASAGAITAALVASGMAAAEVDELIPAGLEAINAKPLNRIAKAALGHAHAVYDGDALRRFLDHTLRTRLGTGTGPVTFAELHAATGIGLYVIAMDLVHGLPVVFSRWTTPTVEVAGAVAASSAIPGAFPAGRAVFDAAGGGAVVHQLIDGGAWANYPSFVFDDESFRVWMRGDAEHRGHVPLDDDSWDAEAARPLVGLVLGDPDPLDQAPALGMVPGGDRRVSRRFDRGPTLTSGKTGSYVFGATLSSDWARLILVVAIAVWVMLSLVVLPVGVRWFSARLDDWLPDAVAPLALVTLVAFAALTVVTAIGTLLLLVVVGRLIAETAIPALRAAVGVPLDVPPWLGLGSRSVVLFVPRGNLKTTRFSVDAATRTAVVSHARMSVADQLDRLGPRLDALLDGRQPPAATYQPGTRPFDEPPTLGHQRGLLGAGTVTLVAIAASVLAWVAVRTAGTGSIWWVVLTFLGGLMVAGIALRIAAGRAAEAAAAQTRATAPPPGAARAATLVIAAGAALLIAGVVVSGLAAADRADRTDRGRVAEAVKDADGTNTYTITVEDGSPLTVVNERHLRLNEAVFVERTGDGWKLAGGADSAWFAVAVALVGVGLVVITIGEKRRRMTRHNRRVDELASAWRAVRPTPS